MEQPICQIVEDMFIQFINNHREKLDEMKVGSAIPITFFLAATIAHDITALKVYYVAKGMVQEATDSHALHYFFLTEKFDKLFTYRMG